MPAVRYGAAVFSVGVAFVLVMLVPWLRQRESFILFFAAISFSAWYGGYGPALLSCALTAFLHDYFVFYPPWEFSFGLEEVGPLLLFLAVAIMISSMTHSLARAEAQARDQRQWLEVVLSSIGDAVIATDAHGNVTFINHVAQALTQWKPGEAQGQPIARVFDLGQSQPPAEVEDPIACVLKDCVTLNLPPGAALPALNGARIPIEGNAAPIKNAEGQAIGVVIVFRDVKEREEARRQILEYQRSLRSMASEVSLAEERERRAIATGLHDRIGQSLALARIKLGALRARLAQPELAAETDEVSHVLKQIVSEVRSLTFELSPPILYEFGLDAALEWLTDSVQKQHGLTCRFESRGESKKLSQESSVLLFQSARELLTNVVKHARAKTAAVRVVKDEHLVNVTVEDDGGGFDPAKAMLISETTKCFGLFSIRERISHMGGTFAVDSDAGRGTRVTLSLPVGA